MAQPLYAVSGFSMVIHLIVLIFDYIFKFVKKIIGLFNKRNIKYILGVSVLILCVLSLGVYLRNNIQKPGDIKVLTNVAKQGDNLELQYSAWIPSWPEDRIIDSVKASRGKLSIISPGLYEVSSEGEIVSLKNDLTDEILKEITDSNSLIFPTLGNNLDGRRSSALLADGDKTRSAILELVNIGKTSNFSGWDIDWESMNPNDKSLFSNFIMNLSEALHSSNMKLSITLSAKLNANDNNYGKSAQDWAFISKYADYIRVMAYDFHNSETPPGPVTPISQLDQSISYAKSVIPLNKLVLALPTYGYDWSTGNSKSVQYDDAIQNFNVNGGTWSLDGKEMAVGGSYQLDGQNHTVWFENSESILDKIKHAREAGIYQFCFWRLGGEDKTLWDKL